MLHLFPMHSELFFFARSTEWNMRWVSLVERETKFSIVYVPLFYVNKFIKFKFPFNSISARRENDTHRAESTHKSNYWWQGAFEEVEKKTMSLFGFKNSIDKSVNMENDKIIYLDFLVLLKNASVCFGWWGRIRPQTRVEARTEKESWRPSFMLFLIQVDEPTRHRKNVVLIFLLCQEIKPLITWLVPKKCPFFTSRKERRSYVIHIFHISHHTTQKPEKKSHKKVMWKISQVKCPKTLFFYLRFGLWWVRIIHLTYILETVKKLS